MATVRDCPHCSTGVIYDKKADRCDWCRRMAEMQEKEQKAIADLNKANKRVR